MESKIRYRDYAILRQLVVFNQHELAHRSHVLASLIFKFVQDCRDLKVRFVVIPRAKGPESPNGAQYNIFGADRTMWEYHWGDICSEISQEFPYMSFETPYTSTFIQVKPGQHTKVRNWISHSLLPAKITMKQRLDFARMHHYSLWRVREAKNISRILAPKEVDILVKWQRRGIEDEALQIDSESKCPTTIFGIKLEQIPEHVHRLQVVAYRHVQHVPPHLLRVEISEWENSLHELGFLDKVSHSVGRNLTKQQSWDLDRRDIEQKEFDFFIDGTKFVEHVVPQRRAKYARRPQSQVQTPATLQPPHQLFALPTTVTQQRLDRPLAHVPTPSTQQTPQLIPQSQPFVQESSEDSSDDEPQPANALSLVSASLPTSQKFPYHPLSNKQSAVTVHPPDAQESSEEDSTSEDSPANALPVVYEGRSSVRHFAPDPPSKRQIAYEKRRKAKALAKAIKEVNKKNVRAQAIQKALLDKERMTTLYTQEGTFSLKPGYIGWNYNPDVPGEEKKDRSTKARENFRRFLKHRAEAEEKKRNEAEEKENAEANSAEEDGENAEDDEEEEEEEEEDEDGEKEAAQVSEVDDEQSEAEDQHS